MHRLKAGGKEPSVTFDSSREETMQHIFTVTNTRRKGKVNSCEYVCFLSFSPVRNKNKSVFCTLQYNSNIPTEEASIISPPLTRKEILICSFSSFASLRVKKGLVCWVRETDEIRQTGWGWSCWGCCLLNIFFFFYEEHFVQPHLTTFSTSWTKEEPSVHWKVYFLRLLRRGVQQVPWPSAPPRQLPRHSRRETFSSVWHAA